MVWQRLVIHTQKRNYITAVASHKIVWWWWPIPLTTKEWCVLTPSRKELTSGTINNRSRTKNSPLPQSLSSSIHLKFKTKTNKQKKKKPVYFFFGYETEFIQINWFIRYTACPQHFFLTHSTEKHGDRMCVKWNASSLTM